MRKHFCDACEGELNGALIENISGSATVFDISVNVIIKFGTSGYRDEGKVHFSGAGELCLSCAEIAILKVLKNQWNS